MKLAIASAAAYLVILGGGMDATMSRCSPSPSDQPGPNGSPVQVVPPTLIGDGIWKVGTDIAPGPWTTPEGWKDKAACRWFVSPADGESGDGLPSFSRRDEYAGPVSTFNLTKGQSLTTASCGTWKQG